MFYRHLNFLSSEEVLHFELHSLVLRNLHTRLLCFMIILQISTYKQQRNKFWKWLLSQCASLEHLVCSYPTPGTFLEAVSVLILGSQPVESCQVYQLRDFHQETWSPLQDLRF